MNMKRSTIIHSFILFFIFGLTSWVFLTNAGTTVFVFRNVSVIVDWKPLSQYLFVCFGSYKFGRYYEGWRLLTRQKKFEEETRIDEYDKQPITHQP